MMIRSFLEGKFKEYLCRSVRAMGSFFCCFRIKDDQNYLSKKMDDQTPLVLESSVPSKPREPFISRFRLLPLLHSEKDGSPCKKDKKNHAFGTPLPDFDDKELKDEAMFLKACGTVIQTPPEIRKASEKLKNLTPHDEGTVTSKFHSWVPNAPIEKLWPDKQPDRPPTSIKFGETWENGSVSSEHTPGSCISNGQISGRNSTCSTEGSVGTTTKIHVDQTHDTSLISPTPLTENVQRMSKSVHFECESDVTSYSSSFSSGIASQNLKQSESAGINIASKSSPYPTPLKLTNEMQTPGTVFPAYLENMANRKNPHIRSQYVYTVLNTVENFSNWKAVKEEDSNSYQLSGNLSGSLEQADTDGPKSEMEMRVSSVEDEMKVEASLSSWLKPQPVNQDDGSPNFDYVSTENAQSGRTPGDTATFGMVTDLWDKDELSHTSPKWCDGNGILNSTKYEKDQKVSCHATPFEERLEKAFSEDIFISQRKQIHGTPTIDLNGNVESDTFLT
ncbi:protein JASON-like [Cornus florida]|uniref:protein JASON-like n=1 Tax=Cornus florida TaxID=4283 RepID=UPI00289F464C|nr:protein JASON-like [Cornus florida]